jgi:hypothetical protein
MKRVLGFQDVWVYERLFAGIPSTILVADAFGGAPIVVVKFTNPPVD